ncbi:acetyl-CoA synthetase-like protein [Trichodelitschia bisporula]|uniref:Acetyl-CoA synthetase-like protein n=1 Tax=Trichodelitschia bisporula TaxID=703511 RepID=A0A6G1HTS5_9PEZI|nr:acetyl-CoA synthetase-like protein [Trichodelitschia bisporula]
MAIGDRVMFVPRHDGHHILPCSPLFSRLLRLAHRQPPKLAIRDAREKIERNHWELLSDVLALREVIKTALGEARVGALQNGEEVYIAVLAPGGYEYTIAVLAVLALGAAVVPLSVQVPMKEAEYFVQKCDAAALLSCSASIAFGQELQTNIVNSTNPHFSCIPIQPSLSAPLMPISNIFVSSGRYLDDNGPGVVIFTSGTTGPPKAAVMRRAYVHDGALSVAEHYELTEHDTMLHVLPVHHATGVGINFFPFLVSGATIEFRSGGFDEVWLWDRWRAGAANPGLRLTFFSGVPTIYMRMRRHYQLVLSKLPADKLAEYIAGARQFRALLCGTSALPHTISDFWTELVGRRIAQRYGATEFGAVFKARLSDGQVPDGSVGERVPGIDLKLSEGDEGEVLVKSPHMFSKYLRDPEATANAHDANGYFKTGDIARREGKYYWIVGRASIDIIKSGGYKISSLDIERELLALPYVAEAMVVGVPDDEFGQRVAAVISLLKEEVNEVFEADHSANDHLLSIDSLRRDLRRRLAGYKMPTLLRVIEGELPKSGTGKVAKKVLGPHYFPLGYHNLPEVQVWRARQAAVEIHAKL